MNKLLGLVKYVILPSIQVSRAIIDKEKQSEICFDTIGYIDTIEALEDINSDTKFELEYKYWFGKLEKCNEEIDVEVVRDILNDIDNKIDYKDGIFVTLELYKNIKEVGLKLLKDYEEEDMIDVLEDCFNFNKDEIENMFNDIDKNVFFLKGIMPILDNLNII